MYKIERNHPYFSCTPSFKMSSQSLTQKLQALAEYGYFALCTRLEENKVGITCMLYLKDYDEETGVKEYLTIDPSVPERDQNDCCVACQSFRPTDPRYRPVMRVRRGMVVCPMCLEWTAPWKFIERIYKGEFLLVEGKPAVQLTNTIPPAMATMISEKLII
jgi:hypothetical protein